MKKMNNSSTQLMGFLGTKFSSLIYSNFDSNLQFYSFKKLSRLTLFSWVLGVDLIINSVCENVCSQM